MTSSDPNTRALRAAGAAILALTTAEVDFEDEDRERAYYARAHPVIEAAIATPATDMAGLRVKAEGVAWCIASRTEFGLGASRAERLIASILRDLLV